MLVDKLPAKARPARSARQERGGGWVGRSGRREASPEAVGGGEVFAEQGGRLPAAGTTASGAECKDVPTDRWDSLPGRWAVYVVLDAVEGQDHE